ncbi:unnamed protein product [Nesidiocoris tenuis]|uniref:Uncharacterized protein n=1 Tax=Nesidiocoris tenuis TaxID=355587 RepID=A0A6H5G7Z2_9HEMI|nr:unnamed protein product [Nesidiocoris tenuis]
MFQDPFAFFYQQNSDHPMCSSNPNSLEQEKILDRTPFIRQFSGSLQSPRDGLAPITILNFFWRMW